MHFLGGILLIVGLANPALTWRRSLLQLPPEVGSNNGIDRLIEKVSCDFQESLCSWRNPETSGNTPQWTRVVYPGPPPGAYVRLDLNQHQGGALGRLVSPWLEPRPRQEQLCGLTFRYFAGRPERCRLRVLQRAEDGRETVVWDSTPLSAQDLHFSPLVQAWPNCTARRYQIVLQGEQLTPTGQPCGDYFNEISVNHIVYNIVTLSPSSAPVRTTITTSTTINVATTMPLEVSTVLPSEHQAETAGASGPEAGAIGGIIVAVIAVFIIIAILVVIIVRRGRIKTAGSSETFSINDGASWQAGSLDHTYANISPSSLDSPLSTASSQGGGGKVHQQDCSRNPLSSHQAQVSCSDHASGNVSPVQPPKTFHNHARFVSPPSGLYDYASVKDPCDKRIAKSSKPVAQTAPKKEEYAVVHKDKANAKTKLRNGARRSETQNRKTEASEGYQNTATTVASRVKSLDDPSPYEDTVPYALTRQTNVSPVPSFDSAHEVHPIYSTAKAFRFDDTSHQTEQALRGGPHAFTKLDCEPSDDQSSKLTDPGFPTMETSDSPTDADAYNSLEVKNIHRGLSTDKSHRSSDPVAHYDHLPDLTGNGSYASLHRKSESKELQRQAVEDLYSHARKC